MYENTFLIIHTCFWLLIGTKYKNLVIFIISFFKLVVIETPKNHFFFFSICIFISPIGFTGKKIEAKKNHNIKKSQSQPILGGYQKWKLIIDNFELIYKI
jgi:hypothetical protein